MAPRASRSPTMRLTRGWIPPMNCPVYGATPASQGQPPCPSFLLVQLDRGGSAAGTREEQGGEQGGEQGEARTTGHRQSTGRPRRKLAPRTSSAGACWEGCRCWPSARSGMRPCSAREVEHACRMSRRGRFRSSRPGWDDSRDPYVPASCPRMCRRPGSQSQTGSRSRWFRERQTRWHARSRSGSSSCRRSQCPRPQNRTRPVRLFTEG